MRKIILLFLFSLSFSVLLFSQNNKEENSPEVFAPFVSRLKAKAVESGIKLTWKDSKDVKGTNLIYRLDKEIRNSNISIAKLIAKVKQGIESYMDYPVTVKKYYYAVLIEDKKGKIYKLLIPFRNKTTTGVAVKFIATEEQRAAKITNLQASVNNDYVLVCFDTSAPKRDLLLFRNTSPFTSAEDLLHSNSPVTISGTEKSYQDYPVPGIGYYYALLDAGLFKIGKIELKAGENTTVNPVMIPLGVKRAGLPEKPRIRPLPLPYLLISSSIDTGAELSPSSPFAFPKYQKLQPAAQKAVNELISSIKLKPPAPKSVKILNSEKQKSKAGEEYTLYTIVVNYLQKRNFYKTEKLLNNFLSIYHSKEVEARAHFYLGQSYYFTGRYKNAFLEFLMAEDFYYEDVQNWLNAVFNVLITSQKQS